MKFLMLAIHSCEAPDFGTLVLGTRAPVFWRNVLLLSSR